MYSRKRYTRSTMKNKTKGGKKRLILQKHMRIAKEKFQIWKEGESYGHLHYCNIVWERERKRKGGQFPISPSLHPSGSHRSLPKPFLKDYSDYVTTTMWYYV